MPEEINRLITDHISDLLFVSEESGVGNLLHEGVAAEAIHWVGNTMIDSLMAMEDQAESSSILDRLRLRAGNVSAPIAHYALLTLHRPSNVDDITSFNAILHGLNELLASYPIVFPVHPRTRRRLEECGSHFAPNATNGAQKGLVAIDPLGYLDFLCLMKHAELVITDSGGVQEETTYLGIPCVTVRRNTERPITVENGTNIIAGTGSDEIRHAIRQQMMQPKHSHRAPEKWDGQAASRIVAILQDALRLRKRHSFESQPSNAEVAVGL
jgi:UDP-N-acetylglucosamine 2-epimerase (non-hydrolysing)